MLSRYLGNKSSILPQILDVIAEVTPQGGRVGDLFAGTMAVSLALKEAGYRVIANDINHFSCTTGRAFISAKNIPNLDIEIVPRRYRDDASRVAVEIVGALRGIDGYKFLESKWHRDRYIRLITVLMFLERGDGCDLPATARRSDFYNAYTADGKNSTFLSKRGSVGKRQFFTPENGFRIDFILSHLRYWHLKNRVSEDALALILSLVCRAMEQVGNTQGTWHDFPREWVDSRAKQVLRFDPPSMDVTLIGGEHLIGNAEDSLDFVTRCPEMDTLYLDPPYNFRQYTSYYFMPNIVTMYPYIENIEEYFANIEFVRGQNMETDHNSVFCKKDKFLDALGALIGGAKTRYVVLSYFNGKNHWNDFKEDPNDIGRNNLEAFFRGGMFVKGSLKVVPLPRKNYQSYRGYKGLEINEYLFVAEKRA